MKTKILLLAALLLVVIVTEAHPTAERDQLKGLTGVEVLIAPIGPDLQKEGVTEVQFKTRMELKLRQTGIRVLTTEERIKAPGAPLLYLVVSGGKIEPSKGYATNISLRLQERVILKRNRTEGLCDNMEYGWFGANRNHRVEAD